MFALDRIVKRAKRTWISVGIFSTTMSQQPATAGKRN
jgi:hypothetical protein